MFLIFQTMAAATSDRAADVRTCLVFINFDVFFFFMLHVPNHWVFLFQVFIRFASVHSEFLSRSSSFYFVMRVYYYAFYLH